MRERVLSDGLLARAGEEVELRGWVQRVRRLRHVSFVVLRDRAGLAQVVLAPGAVEDLREETVVAVRGEARANQAAPGGAELHATQLERLAEPDGELPFALWRPALDVRLPTLLDHAPLALRHVRQRAAFRIAAAAVRGFRRTLDAAGFTEIQTPKVVASATES